MSVKISYSLSALHEASKFIWENNQNLNMWPNQPASVFGVMSQIKETMIRMALKNAEVIRKEKTSVSPFGEWSSYTGTGGYYIICELLSDDNNDDIEIGLDILVDPAVSHHSDAGYVSEIVDNNLPVDTIAIRQYYNNINFND